MSLPQVPSISSSFHHPFTRTFHTWPPSPVLAAETQCRSPKHLAPSTTRCSPSHPSIFAEPLGPQHNLNHWTIITSLMEMKIYVDFLRHHQAAISCCGPFPVNPFPVNFNSLGCNFRDASRSWCDWMSKPWDQFLSILGQCWGFSHLNWNINPQKWYAYHHAHVFLMGYRSVQDKYPATPWPLLVVLPWEPKACQRLEKTTCHMVTFKYLSVCLSISIAIVISIYIYI